MVDEDRSPTEASKEQVYDDVIAPKLREIAAVCRQYDIGFVSEVEWNKGKAGRTVYLPADASWAVRMVEACMRCNGNVDQFILACVQYARIHGHNSVFMKDMGIPESGDHEETARAN